MIENLSFYKEIESYPFFVDDSGVYYVKPTSSTTCELVWLAISFSVSNILIDVTHAVYYELKYLDTEFDAFETQLVPSEVFSKERIHELAYNDIDIDLLRSDLLLVYVSNRAKRAPIIRE